MLKDQDAQGCLHTERTGYWLDSHYRTEERQSHTWELDGYRMASNSTVRRRFKKADLVAHVALKKTWRCSPPQEKITRSQYRVSESQVIVKDFGPLLAFLCRIYFFLLYYCKFHYSTCSTSVYVQFSHT